MEMASAELALRLSGEAMPPRLAAIEPVALPDSSVYHATKRALDVVGSLVALVVTHPLWIAVALLVRGTSRGPVLFRQSRVGRDGRTFMVLKFRSMCTDAEARLREGGLYDTYVATGYKLPVAEEFRVTRIGRLIRKTSIDELPQLINVLAGHMSLVGPRPVVPSELDCYGDLAHCYLGVRPGITGMWQVNGRSDVRFPERAHLDRDYFHRRSLRVDLGILLRTPRAVLRGNGAY
jgi:lipopolysaccharide/colanic/teichoic acid biosynthesis glycosyltransferase